MYTNTPLRNELLQVSIIFQEKSVLKQRTYRDDNILKSKFAGGRFMWSKSSWYTFTVPLTECAIGDCV
jgi:hypothetical protein